jgi:malonyl-CoA O-methyltransferase
MNALSPAEAYRIWAPAYSAETAISQIEDELVSAITPPLDGLRLLDAGCGTGRRLAGTTAVEAVGVDLSPEMLDAGIGRSGSTPPVRGIVGDIRALPFSDNSFDIVWCRLAIGHVRSCAQVYAELGRVARRGARVIVSDFHPAAHAAGHRRTFRAEGRVHEVRHYVHDAASQLTAAADAGLESIGIDEGCIGPSVRHLYTARGKEDLYRDQVGLPVVLVLSFRRSA